MLAACVFIFCATWNERSIFRHVIPHSFTAIAVILCAFLLLFYYYYSTRMVNVLKECDYHQSDERKGMRVSKKEEKKSAHIAHKPSKWRYVYGCNAIYAHLCTGGGDTYFSCVPFTQNVHYNITESTNNWDFLTLFFFFFSVLLCYFDDGGCCCCSYGSVLCGLLQVYFVALCSYISLLKHWQYTQIFALIAMRSY